MARITDKQQVDNIIQMLSLRKKQFVSVSRRIMPKLMKELNANYPKAKFKFIGFGIGKRFYCIRTTSANTLKNGDKI